MGELLWIQIMKRSLNNVRKLLAITIEEDFIEMQILAIGPRDRDKVYEMAKNRLAHVTQN